jgi:succinate dehydrogenase/fumarate reductase flavoprotein subunit
LTKTQIKQGINDSPEKFEEDTALSGSKGLSKIGTPLGKVLTHGSGPAVEWLIDAFGLDLSILSRMGGHSEKRCHRGPERFPGMTITMALLEKLEKIEAESKGKVAKIMSKTKVTKLIKDGKAIIGVEFEDSKGKKGKAFGPVIIATGGYYKILK